MIKHAHLHHLRGTEYRRKRRVGRLPTGTDPCERVQRGQLRRVEEKPALAQISFEAGVKSWRLQTLDVP